MKEKKIWRQLDKVPSFLSLRKATWDLLSAEALLLLLLLVKFKMAYFTTKKIDIVRYYNLLFSEIFMPALADGFLREFQWQEVSSNLQDSF